MGQTFLIIQTAFIGDVILATPVLEKLNTIPGAQIDILVRKGNESLFDKHPFIRRVLIWDKKKTKYKNLFSTLLEIRSNKYDTVVNLQRFASSGFLTALSGANEKIGFSKNPFSFMFTKKVKHIIGNGLHETERNLSTVQHIGEKIIPKPKLYPGTADLMWAEKFKKEKYVTLSPHSVWYTKTFPAYKWVELIQKLNAGSELVQKLKLTPEKFHIYLLGSSSETEFSNDIITKSGASNVTNLCGKLSFLESASLMKDATMNYSNDSAPLHLASAVNAPVTAIYCSTVPEFGFGPLSDVSKIIQTNINLNCRPCGLHGFKECPLTHFKCAHSISIDDSFLP